MEEYTADSVPFVDLAFLKRSEIRELHVVGDDGNLLVELGNLLQIELRHRPRNVRHDTLQEPADVLYTWLGRRT